MEKEYQSDRSDVILFWVYVAYPNTWDKSLIVVAVCGKSCNPEFLTKALILNDEERMV